MPIKKICIIGGTGFVGRALANRLASDGYKLRVLTRDRERHKESLILLPELELVQTDVHDIDRLKSHFAGCDAVINLVGILNERRNNGAEFRKVHVELTEKIITACNAQGIARLLHMSALNADSNAPSQYLRSKGEAETRVHAASGLHVTSFRPSVIFGPEDSLFNRFAALLKIFPLLPLACAEARFSPVYVNDVVAAFALTLDNPAWYGKRLQLGGPQIYTLQEMVNYTANCLGIQRLIVPLPDVLARLQGSVFDLAGFLFALVNIQKPFSTDNYLSLKLDSITDSKDLQNLGITATPLEAVVPQYLSYLSSKSRYYSYRQHSRRNF